MATQLLFLPVIIATNLTHSWVIVGTWLGLMVTAVVATTIWVARNHDVSRRTAFLVTLRRKSSSDG